MARLPTGTVTFLYSDIVGSTRLVQQLGDRYAEMLADYRRLIRATVRERTGHEVSLQGDACLVVFPRARDAVAAAVAAQRTIAGFPWLEGAALRVRMGLHTGEPLRVGNDYVGIDVHHATRIGSSGHGGQILLSEATRILVQDNLPEGISLRDLGVHRLKDLAHPQRLFQIVTADLPSDFPALQSPDRIPNNLPAQLTSFIGREREIGEVKRLLSTTRLLTLTGVGGAGKTRLALEVGAEVLAQFRDGVWLAELATLAEPTLVAQTVAAALRVREQPGRPILATLSNFLEHKDLLLVLDNCEHLVAESAHIADRLLRASPHLRILVTSREPLGIAGETCWRVPSLSLPDVRRLPAPENLTRYEAIRLFVERAVAAEPAFTLSQPNVQAIAWVCHKLDGIPLAVELAAARVKEMSVQEIAARLDDRFRLLTGGSRAAHPRHQTLRAAMDWSFYMLSEPERAVFRRLSAFSSGFTLEAAEAVCAGDGVERSEVLNLVALLVDKSLVLVDDRGGETRYRLLETVRRYGREKLLEAEETANVRRRHRDWCLGLAERAEPELVRSEQSAWLERLEAEHDNFREALEWSLEETDKDPGLRLAGALRLFWSVRGYLSEARGRLERALSGSSRTPTSARAKALYAAGYVANFQHDYEQAVALAEASLAQSQELGEKQGIARSHFLLGFIALGQGEYARATAHLQQSMTLSRELNDKRGIGISLNMLGEVARGQGDYAAAHALYGEDLALRRELGDERGIGIELHNLGYVALHEGDCARAGELFKESLGIRLKLGHKVGIAYCLAGLAAVAETRNQPEPAAKLLGAAETLLVTIGADMDWPDRLEYDRTVSALRTAMGDATFEAALREGRVVPLEQAVELALS